MKRKPPDSDVPDWSWTEPFRHEGFSGVINVGVMTPQQRAEVMARGGPMDITNMGKFVELGVQTSQVQAQKARMPRADEELEVIVSKLAQREGTAKELWSALRDKLDSAGCEPVEDTDRPQRKWKITYTDANGRARGVSFDTFQRKLGKNKKPE